MNRTKRILLRSLLTVLVLLVVVPALLYVPPIQNWVVDLAIGYLSSTDSSYEYNIDKVRIDFPARLRVEGISARYRSTGDTLFFVGKLRTGLTHLPLGGSGFVSLSRFQLEDVVLGTDSISDGFGMTGRVRNLTIRGISVRPGRQRLGVEHLLLEDPDLTMYLRPTPPDSTESEPLGWQFDVADMQVTRGHFMYDRFCLSEIELGATDFCYNDTLLSFVLKGLTTREDSLGISVAHLQTEFSLTHNRLLAARGLDLALDQSWVRGDLGWDLETNTGESRLSARVGQEDLASVASSFMPSLGRYWPAETTDLTLNGKLTADTLLVERLYFRMADHVDVTAQGLVVQPYDILYRRVRMDVNADLPQADFLLSAFLDKDTTERAYRIPDSLALQLRLTGGPVFKGRGEMWKAGRSVLKLDGAYNLLTELYRLQLTTDRLEAGSFVDQLPVKEVTLRLSADGRHFDYKNQTTSAVIDLTVDTLLYRGDNGKRDLITGLDAGLMLERGQYQFRIDSDLPSAVLGVRLDGLVDRKQITTEGDLHVKNIDLAKLPAGLAIDMGKLAFRSSIRFSYDWKERLNALCMIDSLSYFDPAVRQLLALDPIAITAETDETHVSLGVAGGDAGLTFASNHGMNAFSKNVALVNAEIARQMEAFSIDLPAFQSVLPQFECSMDMERDNPFIPILQYYGYDLENLHAEISNAERLHIDSRLYDLTGPNSLRYDTIEFRLQPQQDAYVYRGRVIHVGFRSSDTYDIQARGEIHTDSLTADFVYSNSRYERLFNAHAAFHLAPDSLTIHLLRDPLILGETYVVNKDNFLEMTQFRRPEERRLGLRADLQLENSEGMKLNLYTRRIQGRADGNQALLSIHNLQLQSLARTLGMNGELKGRSDAVLLVDLIPDSLMAQGRIKIDTLNVLNASMLLSDSLQGELQLVDFPIGLLNLFTGETLQLAGLAQGSIRATARTADLERSFRLSGGIAFPQARASLPNYGIHFTFPDDTLRLRDRRLLIPSYRFKADGGGIFALQGAVDFGKSFTDPALDLTVSGQKARLINNSRRVSNVQNLAGRLPVTTDIRVRGTVSDLQVKGDIRVLEGTRLVYWLDEDPLQTGSRVDDMVEFVSFNRIDRNIARIRQTGRRSGRRLQPQKKSRQDINLTINIDKSSEVLVHLPTSEDDRVTLRGGGALQMEALATGDIVASGSYDILSGDVHYKLPMLPVTKTLVLQSGSNISWQGVSIGNPTVHLIASEEVRSTVATTTGATRLVTFRVLCNIDGSLNKMGVTFDCEAPGDGAISTELSGLTSEDRSKQALLLLIAQIYTGPSASSSGGLASASAAVNSLLAKEISGITSGLKHTDINLGIDSYNNEAGQNQTDVSLQVSQRFFDDRVRVTVGGKVSTGAESPAVQSSSEAMLGDVSLDWMIKKDGSQYLELFRRTSYQNILEGQVVEMGAGYAQEKQAFRFIDLFIPMSRKKRMKLQEYIQQLKEKEEREERERNAAATVAETTEEPEQSTD